MYGEVEGTIPGNALTVDPKKPFRNLDPFGNTFLNRCVVEEKEKLFTEVLPSLTQTLCCAAIHNCSL